MVSSQQLKILDRCEPFRSLSQDLKDGIGQDLKPLRLSPGQALFDFRSLPPGVAFVEAGCLRLLAIDDLGEPFTLKKVWPGNTVGWSSLVRGAIGLSVRASCDTRLWLLPKDKFLSLYSSEVQLQGLLQILDIEELFSVASAVRKPDLANSKVIADWAKTETESDSRENKVLLLQPGEHSFDLSWGPWLISTPNLRGLQIGYEVSGPKTLNVEGKIPARLIAKPHLPLVEKPQQPEQSPSEYKDNQVALVAIERETEALEDWYGDFSQSDSYPFFSAEDLSGAPLACLRMLTRYFDAPFRKDTVTRVLEDQRLRNKGNLELCQLAIICEIQGLQTTKVSLPHSQLKDLEFPLLARGPRGEVVVWDIFQDGRCILSDPHAGQLKETIDYLECNVDDELVEVFLVQGTAQTPIQRFGVSWFLPALKKYKNILIQVFAASFFVQLFGLLIPLLIQQIIDAVITQGNLSSLNILGTLLVLMALSQALLSALRTYLFSDVTNRIDVTLASNIIDHLFRLPLKFFGDRPIGEISSRVSELEKVRSFLTGTALTTILDASFAVLYIAVMLLYSVPLTFWALAVVPLFVGVSLGSTPILKRQLREQAEANSRVQSHVVETLGGIETVKAQSMELHSRWKWQQLYGRQVQAGFRNVVLSTASASTTRFLEQLSGLLILWMGAGMVLKGEITLGQLIAFRILANYVTSPLLRLTNLWQNFQETNLSMERLADVVDHKEELEIAGVRNPPLPRIIGDVEYKQVSFRFERNLPLSLNNISFKTHHGSFVGIVGASGSSKSTLLKLLTRLYTPEHGQIRIDGFDISKVDLYSLRSQVGVVPQDSVLFSGSILENISYTRMNTSYNEIVSAARVACAHHFIEDLPNSYNTNVGERGNALSGGQRQRIAIARMITQRPRILVLDEATSALDLETEKQLINNLRAAFDDITIFFITHRIHSLRDADQILVLHEGNLVETGTHPELLNAGGRYHTLWGQQAAQHLRQLGGPPLR